MEWFEELNFDDNPFDLNPIKTDFNLVGREKEDPRETSVNLVSALRKCLREPSRREQMGIAAAGLAVPDAANRIAQELLEMTDE